MGRKSSNPVQEMYFRYNVNTNESVCQIHECTNPRRTGNHAGNLENHIKVFHKEEHILLMKEKEKFSKKTHCDHSTSMTSKVSIFTYL